MFKQFLEWYHIAMFVPSEICTRGGNFLRAGLMMCLGPSRPAAELGFGYLYREPRVPTLYHKLTVSFTLLYTHGMVTYLCTPSCVSMVLHISCSLVVKAFFPLPLSACNLARIQSLYIQVALHCLGLPCCISILLLHCLCYSIVGIG